MYVIHEQALRSPQVGQHVDLAVPFKSFSAHEIPERAWHRMVPYLSQLWWWTPSYASYHRRRSKQPFPVVPMRGYVRDTEGRFYEVHFVRLPISKKRLRLSPSRRMMATYRIMRVVNPDPLATVVEGWRHQVAFDFDSLHTA